MSEMSCPDCGEVHICSGRCEYPGCRASSEFEAWFRFDHGHLVRLHCCREHAKKSIAYEAMGEAAFQPAAEGGSG